MHPQVAHWNPIFLHERRGTVCWRIIPTNSRSNMSSSSYLLFTLMKQQLDIIHVFTKTPPTQGSRKVVRFMQNDPQFILYRAQRTNVNIILWTEGFVRGASNGRNYLRCVIVGAVICMRRITPTTKHSSGPVFTNLIMIAHGLIPTWHVPILFYVKYISRNTYWYSFSNPYHALLVNFNVLKT